MWARAASTDTAKSQVVESIAIGSPVVVVMQNGKPLVKGVTAVLLLLRSDGTVGWTLSAESAKDFEDKAKKGPLTVPHQYGGKKK
jgi:hypothetical protein